MELKGKLAIVRPLGGDSGQINIHVEDDQAGVRFLEIVISLENFAKAITGQGGIDCNLKIRALSKVGLIREHKSMRVFVPDHAYSDREEVAGGAVRKAESDGWIGRIDDAHNHHKIAERTDAGNYYNVVFIRHVERAE